MAKGVHEISKKMRTVKGAHEIVGKKKFPARSLILLLLLLALSVGGVTAYLSTSSNSLTNKLQVATMPTVTVGSDNSITVPDMGYAMYLRTKVVVNWERIVDGNREILAEIPVQGIDYGLTISDTSRQQWYYKDGYYYYNKVIAQDGDLTTAPVVTVTKKTSKEDYNLKVTILAQTVQAVGTTDEDHTTPNKDAVFDAWGVEASEFIGKTNP